MFQFNAGSVEYSTDQSKILLKFDSWFKRRILHVPNRIEIMLNKAWFKRRILHAPNQILILVDSNE